MLRGWYKQAYKKSKMANGRQLEKSKNDLISATARPTGTKLGKVAL